MKGSNKQLLSVGIRDKTVKALLVGMAVLSFLLVSTACRDEPEQPLTSAVKLPPPKSAPTPIGSEAASNDAALPPAQTLNLQANHPSGAQLQIKNISFEPELITVNLAATNSSKQAIALNQSQMLLQDNLGNQYNLLPLPENAELEITSGETLSGELMFIGRINAEATSLSLITNEGEDEQTQTTYPRIVVEGIPVQLVQ